MSQGHIVVGSSDTRETKSMNCYRKKSHNPVTYLLFCFFLDLSWAYLHGIVSKANHISCRISMLMAREDISLEARPQIKVAAFEKISKVRFFFSLQGTNRTHGSIIPESKCTFTWCTVQELSYFREPSVQYKSLQAVMGKVTVASLFRYVTHNFH